MRMILISLLTLILGSVSVQAACKLPAEEAQMELFKKKFDHMNDGFYDNEDDILKVLETIVRIGNQGKGFSEEDIQNVINEYVALKPYFGKMYIYVNFEVGQMMLWVEDKEGCYMGHGKHTLALWSMVKTIVGSDL